MSSYTKTPAEARDMVFDFSTKAPTGAVLSNPTVSKSVLYGPGAASDLTLGSPTVSALLVTVLVSAGTNATKYRVGCQVDSDNGEHYELEQDILVNAASGVVP